MGISSWRVSNLNESWHIAGSIDRNAEGSGPHEIEARQLEIAAVLDVVA